MANALITLTTDFGEDSPYVAAMKGVVLSIHPQARLVDLSHHIPPQDIRHTDYFLAGAIPYFPRGTVHVVVVDPGVGSERAILCIEWQGSLLVVPDNGCWTSLEKIASPCRVWALTRPDWWRYPVSPTFHGRDILAPVAAYLSQGVAPELLGEQTRTWVRLDLSPPVCSPTQIEGEVRFVDRFGNLITNIPRAMLEKAATPIRCVRLAGQEILRQVRSYADAPAQTLVTLISSTGRLEIALTQGSAARQLGCGVGTRVVVDLGQPAGKSVGPE